MGLSLESDLLIEHNKDSDTLFLEDRANQHYVLARRKGFEPNISFEEFSQLSLEDKHLHILANESLGTITPAFTAAKVLYPYTSEHLIAIPSQSTPFIPNIHGPDGEDNHDWNSNFSHFLRTISPAMKNNIVFGYNGLNNKTLGIIHLHLLKLIDAELNPIGASAIPDHRRGLMLRNNGFNEVNREIVEIMQREFPDIFSTSFLHNSGGSFYLGLNMPMPEFFSNPIAVNVLQKLDTLVRESHSKANIPEEQRCFSIACSVCDDIPFIVFQSAAKIGNAGSGIMEALGCCFINPNDYPAMRDSPKILDEYEQTSQRFYDEIMRNA